MVLWQWMEQPAPDISQLTQQLTQVLATEAQQLVWASTNGHVALKAVKLCEWVRRDRALPVIEQYQWIPAAFANPVPALDLAATLRSMPVGYGFGRYLSTKPAGSNSCRNNGKLDDQTWFSRTFCKAIGIVLKSNTTPLLLVGEVQGQRRVFNSVSRLEFNQYFQQQSSYKLNWAESHS